MLQKDIAGEPATDESVPVYQKCICARERGERAMYERESPAGSTPFYLHGTHTSCTSSRGFGRGIHCDVDVLEIFSGHMTVSS